MTRNILCHSKVALRGLTSLRPGDVLRIDSNWNLLVTTVEIQGNAGNKRTIVVDGYYVLAGEINTPG